jgi:signal peptidase I
MKNWLSDNRGFIAMLIGLALFRTAIADWNPIPSGSMRPNLLEGDVVFVDRLAYNVKLPLTDIVLARLHDPKRGDIVTFSSPKDGTRLIKRIVALPGDTVAMKDEVLVVNGVPSGYRLLKTAPEPLGNGAATTARRYEEITPGGQRVVQTLDDVGAYRSFGPVVVPADHYLMLGDNRDNSADSRYFGFVPRNLLIGRAERILVSADIKGDWLPRFDRFGMKLD